jgi:predicted transposase YbfD/YdcC
VHTWRLHAFDIEPLSADFPYARTLIVLRSERTVKKTGQSTTESRYYLSSVPAQDDAPRLWLELIRGHWGGVEVRNHWRRDALMGEDRSRSRHAKLLANLALIRNSLLQVLSPALEHQSLPQLRETLHSHPGRCLALLTRAGAS